jgi:quercetin dioxygenase-like cupin family protein
MSDASFPPLITNLPEADLPIKGVRAWMLKSDQGLVVFFDFEAGVEVPEHQHGDQWGIVVEGEMSLTVEGETRLCRKGDSYWIPAGTPHAAYFHKPSKLIDLFADVGRYRPRAS